MSYTCSDFRLTHLYRTLLNEYIFLLLIIWRQSIDPCSSRWLFQSASYTNHDVQILRHFPAFTLHFFPIQIFPRTDAECSERCRLLAITIRIRWGRSPPEQSMLRLVIRRHRSECCCRLIRQSEHRSTRCRCLYVGCAKSDLCLLLTRSSRLLFRCHPRRSWPARLFKRWCVCSSGIIRTVPSTIASYLLYDSDLLVA